MSNGSGAASVREVAAVFGSRQVRPDPAWEVAFANHLREKHSREDLLDLFGRFRSGEGAFDRLMRRVLVRALAKSVGNDLQVETGVVLKHPETMEFGDSVFLGAQCMIQGRFDGTCKIGNHVWIGPQAYFDARCLVLDDYVGWGPGAKVLGSAHTGEPVEEPIISTPLVIRPVIIGFGADVGTGAVILPGVRVGANAIIGAGAVVNHDVPDYAVAAGVPARVLRDRRSK
ncbi:MAG TPA: acyltransferase [Terriglobales bacterium]|jgi:acetyltransferase-like isoleucine patch superfamily enzyme|nr:acyltransferase [Terriglobales bacterium]